MKTAVLIGILLLLFADVRAQVTIYGVVRDAKTGVSLAATNIGIAQTGRGTISNEDGAYTLHVPELPASVVFRYIGYRTATVTVTAATEPLINVALEPVTIEMTEVVVTGENPARNIMRRVIEKKQEMLASLTSYEVDAYNRFAIRNDTGIVSILESVTRAYWDRERGRREVVTFERQTSNLDIDEAIPAAMFVANLYDDDVEISGYNFVGVTHPNALDRYRFQLEGRRYIDDQLVYDISVEPKTKLIVGFVGSLSVLSETFVLLEVELRPGDAFLFPPPVQRYDVTMRQQYREFEGGVWLPADYRSTASIEVGAGRLFSLPVINLDQVSRLTHYRLNVTVPDSLYQTKSGVVVDSAAVAAADDSTLEAITIPLSAAEELAYRSIDSTLTIEKAFQPRGLFGSRVKIGVDSGSNEERKRLPVRIGVRPDARYNRVDGLRLGGAPSLALPGGELKVGGEVAYSTAIKRWSYEVNGLVEPLQGLEIGAAYVNTVAPNYTSEARSVLINSIRVALNGTDYFDYHIREGWQTYIAYEVEPVPVILRVKVVAQDYQSVAKQTDYDLTGGASPQPPNLPINDGRVGAIVFGALIGTEPPQLPVAGARRLSVEVERATPTLFDSDFSYTRFSAVADWRLETFFRRRLLANTLDLRLVASTHNGALPVQRLLIVDTSDGPLTPFGSLRTAGDRPLVGDRTLAVYWEHNFRTVPFELLGIRRLVSRGISILVHGAHGRAWLSDESRALAPRLLAVPDRFHHEIGFSLNGLFGSVRLDFTKRLDAAGYSIGLGVARLF